MAKHLKCFKLFSGKIFFYSFRIKNYVVHACTIITCIIYYAHLPADPARNILNQNSIIST